MKNRYLFKGAFPDLPDGKMIVAFNGPIDIEILSDGWELLDVWEPLSPCPVVAVNDNFINGGELAFTTPNKSHVHYSYYLYDPKTKKNSSGCGYFYV